MPVLIDTSSWIRFFQSREPYLTEVDGLLARDAALGHEFVYGELLIGDPGGRVQFLKRYNLLPWAERCEHRAVISLINQHRLHGRGIGWIDAHLLATAQRDGISLLTADTRLATIASELGLNHGT